MRMKILIILTITLILISGYYYGIVICLYTGIRLGELLALTWDDIDFEKKLMSINKSVCTLRRMREKIVIIDRPKTKTSIRMQNI